MNKKEAAGYLAAMIDGEGNVSDRCIRIANTEEDILVAIENAADVLGLKHSRHPYSNGCSVVYFGGRENIERLFRLVPIQSARKRKALEEAIFSYCKGVYKAYGDVDLERLAALLKKKIPHREIARRMGFASHSSVQRHAKSAGLI